MDRTNNVMPRMITDHIVNLIVSNNYTRNGDEMIYPLMRR